MSKHSYTEIEFKNAPDHKTTPLNASNLNHMEGGISDAFTDISETQEIIAPVEDTLTASQAYAVGDQFIYQNVLYKATAAISAGGSISINGNCAVSDDITTQIKGLNTKISEKAKILGRVATITFSANANEKGYKVATISGTVPAGGRVFSILPSIANTAISGGLQVTPTILSGNQLYFNYYAPTAFTNLTVSFDIYSFYTE